MKSPGYYHMARGWLDHPALKERMFCRRAAWADMIEMACWRTYSTTIGGRTVDLQRGEFSASIRFLAKRWGWSKGKTERFINRLKEHEMIRTRAVRDPCDDRSETGTASGTPSGTGQLIISVSNYERYQTSRSAVGTSSETGSKTGAGQQRDSSGTKKKEIKEGNEGKESEGGASAPPAPIVAIDDCGQAVRAFNAVAERAGLPLVQKLTDARRRALKSRLADCGPADGWAAALAKLEASSFCRGRNDRAWVADFDFLVRESSFVKLMEGKYDDRDGNPNGPFTNGFAELAASGGV